MHSLSRDVLKTLSEGEKKQEEILLKILRLLFIAKNMKHKNESKCLEKKVVPPLLLRPRKTGQFILNTIV